MEFTGTRLIDLPPARVWELLSEPESLRPAIHGCTDLTGSVATGFEVTVVQKIGPLKATFRGSVTPVEVIAPQICHMVGTGKGGIAGALRGTAEVRLAAHPTGTELRYRIGAEVAGMLQRLGGRLVESAAERVADGFFARVFGPEVTVTNPAARAE